MQSGPHKTIAFVSRLALGFCISVRSFSCPPQGAFEACNSLRAASALLCFLGSIADPMKNIFAIGPVTKYLLGRAKRLDQDILRNRRILADQMEFLMAHVPKTSRLLI